MPEAKEKTPTEDDYWAATDKELVVLRGSFKYGSWLLCGGSKPDTFIPKIQYRSYFQNTPNIGSVFYYNQSMPILLTAQGISTYSV